MEKYHINKGFELVLVWNYLEISTQMFVTFKMKIKGISTKISRMWKFGHQDYKKG